MQALEQFLRWIFIVDSIWAVIMQAAIWFIICVVIIVSTDNHDQDATTHKVRTNLGYLSLFLVLAGALFFMLFGYTPSST